MKLRIGTRGSALALWQADHIADRLRETHPGLEIERIIFKTRGDHILDRPLAEIGGKGLFTKELEVALDAEEIDLAVHSLKDMPTTMPPGLILGAIPTRGDVRDCVVTRSGEPPKAPSIIGTASLRRGSLALRRWPDARIEPIRGNVQTRVGRLFEAGSRRVDAVLLAWVGLQRIKQNERKDVEFLPLNPEHWIPAVGQGALAVQCRESDSKTQDTLAALHHQDTAACVTAERAFLRGVEGDCRVPVGALATIDRDMIRLKAFVGHPDGSAMVDHIAFGRDPERLGAEVATLLLQGGGAEILAAVRE